MPHKFEKFVGIFSFSDVGLKIHKTENEKMTASGASGGMHLLDCSSKRDHASNLSPKTNRKSLTPIMKK
jgi:hypothetical protein